MKLEERSMENMEAWEAGGTTMTFERVETRGALLLVKNDKVLWLIH
jgi:hypothetical protein